MSLVDKYLGDGRSFPKDKKAHLKKITDKIEKNQKKKGFKVTDRTPKGYGPNEVDKYLGDSKTPLLDKYKKSKKKGKGNMECMECGKKFKTSKTFDVKCPKCGGYDIEVA